MPGSSAMRWPSGFCLHPMPRGRPRQARPVGIAAYKEVEKVSGLFF